MENFTVYEMVIGISLMIILSYGFNTLAKKTNIPSVLMLITTGAILGAFLEVKTETLQPVLEVLGTVGLIMIVLEAALDLHLEKEKSKLLLKSFLAAIIIFSLTAFPIALLFSFFFGIGFQPALIYAIPLSIISSAIIIPSVGNLNPYLKEYLIMESAFSDILGIMAFYFLADISNMGEGASIGTHIGVNIGLTLIFAIVLGYAVSFLLDKFTGDVKLFLPIATLLLLYAVGKMFHLSSLIFVLAFGLMINNRKLFFRGKLSWIVQEDRMKDLTKELTVVTLESSFVIRTFFFLIFGMSISFSDLYDLKVFLIGLFVLAVIYGIRFLYLSVFDRKNIFPTIAIAPRGLITVLLFYSIPVALQIEGFQPGILLLAIIVSNGTMAYGLIKAKGIETQQEQETTQEATSQEEEKATPNEEQAITPDETSSEEIDERKLPQPENEEEGTTSLDSTAEESDKDAEEN